MSEHERRQKLAKAFHVELSRAAAQGAVGIRTLNEARANELIEDATNRIQLALEILLGHRQGNATDSTQPAAR